MTRALIATLPLIEGETPSGYVSRLLKRHDTTPRDFCSDLGLHWPSLCSGHGDQLERLAWLTGYNLSRLKFWAATQITSKRYQVGNAIASTHVFRRTACRLCPVCVYEARTKSGAQGIFELLEWKVLSLHRCDKHGAAFMTLPTVGHSHEAYDFATRALQHWQEIEMAVAEETFLPKTAFEDHVRARLRGGELDDWLAEFDLTHLQGACLNLGAAIEGVKPQMMGQLQTEETHRMLELGYSYLCLGPTGLDQALRKIRKGRRGERSYYSSDLGPFYTWLCHVADDSTLAPLIDTTRSYIFEHYPVSQDKEVLGKKPSREIWLTMEEARKRSGFGSVFLKKLLGYMHGLSEAEALSRTDVKVSELDAVKEFWSAHMNLSQAADALSLRTDQVKVLIRIGVLRSVKISSSLRYALSEDVVALLSAVADLPLVVDQQATLPLSEYCRRKRISLWRVLQEWREGTLEGVLYQGCGKGISAVEIAWDAECERHEPTLKGDLVLPEVARHLKISIGSIRHLRDAGYLTQVRRLNPDTNHLKNYITRSSIRCFEQTYITLGQLAFERQVEPIHLARKIDHEGLMPISCRSDMVRVYRRDVVMGQGA